MERYGSKVNKQQGPQEPSLGKSNSAETYGRSSQRAAPSGNTPGLTNDYPAERRAQAKRLKLDARAARTRRYLGGS